MTESAKIGLIGLAVMGRNLVLNMADHGYTVAVHNRTRAVTDEFVASIDGKPVLGCASVNDLIAKLERPRKVVLMVKAGPAVDDQIRAVLPMLEAGDILIDAGNSHFADTIRRGQWTADSGVEFLGVGVSGGEAGARHGPAIMAGGAKHAYRSVEPILTDIAARVANQPCCGLVGSDGAGHFVKMIHNGIEYADMQLIAEIYVLMRDVMGLDYGAMADRFSAWNAGALASYLIEITADILRRTDRESGRPILDIIDDAASHKGTGVWTVNAALDLGVPVPTIAAAVFNRAISASSAARHAIRHRFPDPATVNGLTSEMLEQALIAGKVLAYAQGFSLLSGASATRNWSLSLDQIAGLWRGGCIIRAEILSEIAGAFRFEPDLPSLLAGSAFATRLQAAATGLRDTVAIAVRAGISVPGLASAITYLDGLRAGRLGTNLVQAQRDYFGAHTYRRTDRDGIYHTDWGDG